MPPKRNPMDRRYNLPNFQRSRPLKITVPGGEIRKRALADISSSVHNTPQKRQKKRKAEPVNEIASSEGESSPPEAVLSRTLVRRTGSSMSVVLLSPRDNSSPQSPCPTEPQPAGIASPQPPAPSVFSHVKSTVTSHFEPSSPYSMSPGFEQASAEPLPALDREAVKQRIETLQQAVDMSNHDMLFSQTDNHHSDGYDHHTLYPEQHKGMPPSVTEAIEAFTILGPIIHPRRGPNSPGFKRNTKFSEPTMARLLNMERFLRRYTNPAEPTYGKWGRASEMVAMGEGLGVISYARKLRQWTARFISDHETLPLESGVT